MNGALVAVVVFTIIDAGFSLWISEAPPPEKRDAGRVGGR
jgi:hypothetical protein